MSKALKGTVSIISSDPPCKYDNAQFTAVPLRGLSDIKYINQILKFIVLKTIYFHREFSTKVTLENILELNTFRTRKTTITSTFLIKLRFQWYRCESGIATSLLYAEFISAGCNQGSVMCLLSILNQQKQFGGYIFLSIYLIIKLEL